MGNDIPALEKLFKTNLSCLCYFNLPVQTQGNSFSAFVRYIMQTEDADPTSRPSVKC